MLIVSEIQSFIKGRICEKQVWASNKNAIYNSLKKSIKMTSNSNNLIPFLLIYAPGI
jgi:hypothetical protein